jgi:hypothetical protein
MYFEKASNKQINYAPSAPDARTSRRLFGRYASPSISMTVLDKNEKARCAKRKRM